MVQYHGLLLLYAMKQNDTQALTKLVNAGAASTCPTSPLAIAMSSAHSVRLLSEDDTGDLARDVYEMLLKFLRHSSDVALFLLLHRRWSVSRLRARWWRFPTYETRTCSRW